MPTGDLYLDADGETARLLCRRCGRVWQIQQDGTPRMRLDEEAIAGMLRAAWPEIQRQHTECAPDRIGPDDEAWLREALK